MPLRRGAHTTAVLTLWSRSADAFDAEMRRLLDSLADNVSFALDTLATRDRYQRVAAQRTDLLRRLVVAQEDERARIAADVHDDSVQTMAAVDLRLGLLARRAREAAPDLEPAVAQIQEMVSHATVGLRDLLFDLEPVAGDVDLVELLRDALNRTFERGPTGWELTVSPAGARAELADEVSVQAFRIVQEALLNVRRHARAEHVAVTVRPDATGVEIEVTDDGVGLDATALEPGPVTAGCARCRTGRRSSAGGAASSRDPAAAARSRSGCPGPPRPASRRRGPRPGGAEDGGQRSPPGRGRSPVPRRGSRSRHHRVCRSRFPRGCARGVKSGGAHALDAPARSVEPGRPRLGAVHWRP